MRPPRGRRDAGLAIATDNSCAALSAFNSATIVLLLCALPQQRRRAKAPKAAVKNIPPPALGRILVSARPCYARREKRCLLLSWTIGCSRSVRHFRNKSGGGRCGV